MLLGQVTLPGCLRVPSSDPHPPHPVVDTLKQEEWGRRQEALVTVHEITDCNWYAIKVDDLEQH